MNAQMEAQYRVFCEGMRDAEKLKITIIDLYHAYTIRTRRLAQCDGVITREEALLLQRYYG